MEKGLKMTDEELSYKLHSLRQELSLLLPSMRSCEKNLLLLREAFDLINTKLYPLEVESCKRRHAYHILPKRAPHPPKPPSATIAEALATMPESVRISFFRTLCESVGISEESLQPSFQPEEGEF